MMDIDGMDYYEFLEIQPTASVKQIEKAYRRKALRLHPDKNPNNPSAKKNFERLTEIFNLLSDPVSKGEYDQKLRARKDKRVRDAEMDAKRRKYKEDLEERERKFSEEKERKLVHDVHKQREIERVRKRNSEILQAENEKIRTEVEKDLLDILNKLGPGDEPVYRLKVEWSSNIKNSDASLAKIFSRFGQPSNIKIDKKGDSAYIEYSERNPVLSALKAKLDNVTVRGVEMAVTTKTLKDSTNSPYGIKLGQKLEDFEKEVLEKMKTAQQYRNMARQNLPNPTASSSPRNVAPPTSLGMSNNFGPRNEPFQMRFPPVSSPVRNNGPQNAGPIPGNYGIRSEPFPMRFSNNPNLIRNVPLQPTPAMRNRFRLGPEPFHMQYLAGPNSYQNLPPQAPMGFGRRVDFHPWRFG